MIRAYHSLAFWLSITGVLLLISMFVPVAISVVFTIQVVQHECQALTDITSKPVIRPASPAKDPSREEAWIIYRDLVRWKQSDHC